MFSEDIQAVPKGAPPPKGPMTFLLNSEENMYADIRDLNFSAVGQYLSREAKKIAEAFKVSFAALKMVHIYIYINFALNKGNISYYRMT